MADKKHVIWSFFANIPVWSKELFTELDANARVVRRYDRIAEGYNALACYLFDHSRQEMFFCLLRSHPRGEETQFSVVTIICHPHLRSDEQYAAIKSDDSTVVYHVLVYDWPVDEE